MQDPYSEQLDACKDARMVAACLLQKTKRFSGASMVNVQLLDRGANVLRIAAQVGFTDQFLNAFREVDCKDHSVCAEALKRREAVTMEDVSRVKELMPYRAVFANAGVRAVRSIPLISRSRILAGMVSVHFPEPRDFGLADLVTVARFATLAADKLIFLSRDTPKEGQAKWAYSQSERARTVS